MATVITIWAARQFFPPQTIMEQLGMNGKGAGKDSGTQPNGLIGCEVKLTTWFRFTMMPLFSCVGLGPFT